MDEAHLAHIEQQKAAVAILVPQMERWLHMYSRGLLTLAEFSAECQTEILKAAAATGCDY